MKLLTVIKRELLTRVRTRGFIIFTVLIPVLGGGFLFMEYAIISASNRVASSLAVVDLSNQLYPDLAQVLATHTANGQPLYRLRAVEATPATVATVEESLRSEVLSKKIDSYLVIPADVMTSRRATFHVRNAANFNVSVTLQDALRSAINRAHMTSAGVPAAEIAAMSAEFNLDQIKVSATGDKTDNAQTAIMAGIMVMALYVFLIMYGVVVLKSVTEEKTSRISEVLLSAVDPFTLMLGKILGVAATALVQAVIWGVCLALAGAYSAVLAHAAGTDLAKYVPHVPAELYLAFVAFFVLGFLLYASLYAAIGAMVSSDQEAQQTQMPLTMLLVVAAYLAFLVMANPTSTTSVVLSLIPFFTPVLMLMRIAVSNPPAWQIGLSLVLLLGVFLLFTKITAKIYRIGILMTGKRPTLPELLRWLKYA